MYQPTLEVSLVDHIDRYNLPGWNPTNWNNLEPWLFQTPVWKATALYRLEVPFKLQCPLTDCYTLSKKKHSVRLGQSFMCWTTKGHPRLGLNGFHVCLHIMTAYELLTLNLSFEVKKGGVVWGMHAAQVGRMRFGMGVCLSARIYKMHYSPWYCTL